MRRLVILFIVLIFLALSWAALHDIIKGNEPNYIGEYMVLTGSAVVFTILIAFFLIKKRHRKGAHLNPGS